MNFPETADRPFFGVAHPLIPGICPRQNLQLGFAQQQQT
jgi:hypothetical protein